MKKNDILVLGTIKKVKATNSLKSVPVTTLLKEINLSHATIRSSIRLLIKNELVAEGYMQRNARTYYITEQGIELINNLYKGVKTKEEEEE